MTSSPHRMNRCRAVLGSLDFGSQTSDLAATDRTIMDTINLCKYVYSEHDLLCTI